MGLKEIYTATGAKILGASTAAKTIGAVAAASAVIAGTAAGVHAYTNGLDFTPNGEGRALRANQVHFDGSENTIGKQDEQTKSGESEMYERDENAEEKEKPQTGDSASYLFDNMKQQENQNGLLDGSGTAAAIAGTVPANSAASAQPGTVLDIVKNPAAADIVLHPGDVAQVTPSTGGDTANSGTNGGQPSVTPANPSTGGDTTPNQPSRPTTPDSNNGGSGGNSSSGGENGGGSTGGATTPDTPVTPVTPTTPEKPQQTDGKPPEQTSEEKGPNIFGESTGTRFDGTVTPSDSSNVVIAERLNNADALYVGQVINDADIVRALSAYVTVDGEIYYWTSDDLGKYIKINRVSFDGGKTWVTDFTNNIEIPKSASDQPMKIDISYRFSEKESWTDYNPGEGRDHIDCSVVPHRILVLSRDLTDEDTEIPLDIVLNGNYYYNDFSKNLNLYAVQRKLYEKLYGWSSSIHYDDLPPLTKLFPGWMEDGELVDWDYTCDGGRHVLQPSDFVDVPEGYTVRLKINKGMTWETQTLTGFDDSVLDRTESENGTLTVPDYIQAVALEDEVTPISTQSAYGDEYSDVCSSNVADYFKIPASVVYIRNDGCGNVLKGYIVDEDNPNYAATEDGILTNSDKTEYLAVPVLTESVTVPDTVEKVNLPQGYSGTVVIEPTETLPEINFDSMIDGKVAVSADMTNAIVKKYGVSLSKEQNTLCETDTEKEYDVHDGYLTHDEDGETVLDRVVTDAIIYTMPEGVTKIGAEAFSSSGTPNLQGILLMDDDTDISFDEDCFANAGKTVDIICTTEEQVSKLQRELSGVEGVNIKPADKSAEGYSYIELDGKLTLLKAPQEITEFDGMIEIDGTKVSIDNIAAHAFDGCSTLEYVSLPETVKTIGVSAFENCSALSGVMIESTDTVTVMDRAFDNCTNLRFIASNAENMTLENDYDILSGSGSDYLYNELWAPTYREGYGDGWLAFTEDAGITSYHVQNENGLKLLYGATGDQNWLAIRAAADVNASLLETTRYSLDPNTTEIYEQCFSNLEHPFTINWDELPELFAIDDYAFAYSGLSGTLKLLNADYYIQLGDSAFNGTQLEEADFSNVELSNWGRFLFNSCPNLKKVTMGAVMINPPGTTNEGEYSSVVRALSFFDCPSFEEFVFTTQDPIGLLTEGYHERYVLRDDSTDRDIKITLTEGDRETYYEKWRSKFIGYTDEEIEDGTYYTDIAMFEIGWMESYFPEDKWPEYAQAVCDYRVIHAENNLRAMLGMELLDEPENPEEHKEDYGYVDPWGDFDWGDWFNQPADKPVDTTPNEDDGQLKIDIEIPDENPDITQDGSNASDETVSDETGGETVSGDTETGGATVSDETETGEDTPSVDAPDEQDTPSADTNNTEPAPEVSDAAEGETT